MIESPSEGFDGHPNSIAAPEVAKSVEFECQWPASLVRDDPILYDRRVFLCPLLEEAPCHESSGVV
jgi:hypothetical protein